MNAGVVAQLLDYLLYVLFGLTAPEQMVCSFCEAFEFKGSRHVEEQICDTLQVIGDRKICEYTVSAQPVVEEEDAKYASESVYIGTRNVGFEQQIVMMATSWFSFSGLVGSNSIHTDESERVTCRKAFHVLFIYLLQV